MGCFNISGDPLLPTPEGEFHDRLSLENCASQCFYFKHPVAGVEGGNHCWCGNATNLASPAAKSRVRPAAECAATNCTGAKSERCGGSMRMFAYTFNCSVVV